jgi:branched-chain amino acid transport system permease protein
VKALLRRRAEVLVLLAVLPVVLLLPGGTPVGVLGLGIVSAAGLALQAAGVVLVFRSNRFVNFAQLQIGAVAGTLFALLVNAQPVFRGVNAVCPPCLERVTPTLLKASYWGSLVVSLLFAVGLSWLLYLLVVRKLERAPRLVLTVASIFLITLLAGVQRALVTVLTTEDQRQFGGMTRPVPPPLDLELQTGSARFVTADFLSVGVAVAALVAVALYLARSRTGTAIRATAENASRAQTLGVDVVRVNSRVWMLVGALSGAAAVLAAMSAPAGDGTAPAGATVLVRILVVVVVARFTSLPMAGLAALAFGVLNAAVQYSIGSTTVLDGTLVLVISGLLLLQRRESSRADRDTSSAYLAGRQVRPVPPELRDVPSVRSLRRSLGTALLVVLVGAPFMLSPSQTSTLATTVIYAVVGMSLLVLTGWAGQVSLGQFGFAAVGGWVAAVSGLPFLPALLLAALAGSIVAVLVGLPALRLQGLTLAVSTLAFASSVLAVLLNPDQLGRYLPDSLARPVLLGVDLDDQRAFYYVTLLFLALTVTGVAGLRRSRTARVLIAARDNEAAAQSFGISLLRARLQAFAVSGFLAALAGALFAYQQGSVAADAYGVEQSLLLFTFTVIGGLGSIAGPLVGFGALAVLTLSTTSPGLLATINGLGGIGLLLLAPGGLAQLGYDLRDGLLRRIARRAGIVVPSLEGPATAEGVAPISPKTGPSGSTAFVPVRYALDRQWATTTAARAAVEARRG